jgi:hypothetical protein
VSERSQLPERRPRFAEIIEWSGAVWLVEIGLDPEGRARELFLNLADERVEVDELLLTLLHDAAITVSHLLQHGVDAAIHAARLAAHRPSLLSLALTRAAEVADREGERVRALEAWRAERIETGTISPETIRAAEMACGPPDRVLP